MHSAFVASLCLSRCCTCSLHVFVLGNVMPNIRFNLDVQKRRSALLLHAG
jgi:hypothetical protein